MTSDLKYQRENLISNNQLLDERRKFTEAVLSGITSCVLSIDNNGNIQIANTSACRFFNKELSEILGINIIDIMPQFSDILIKAYKSRENIDEYISVKINDYNRNLHIKITKEEKSTKSPMVIAFDDVTDLFDAQRTSVWADVARRIAHEIKNPLTPIQLSAERLKRKYKDQIVSDIEVFEDCTDTIIRQVGDLGKIVDEFSAFAKVPSANMSKYDICDTIRQAVLLQKITFESIIIKMDLPEDEIIFNFDRRLISQALINLIKNASESIFSNNKNITEGLIEISLKDLGEEVSIQIKDNGIGFPSNDTDKLLEPYYTTREMGTGIGLSVVKNIIEVHKGIIKLDNKLTENSSVIGAIVTLFIPKTLNNDLEMMNE
jgi:two-component system nitrogen regulation sensor histidine kinase NtrY